ncbi:MAG: hypothetical protein NWE88_03775 [Candidatus Bathyarchaeota archaeon]|nr:hypothetical protein [Candidatus Bathyarchaeota archaeon]
MRKNEPYHFVRFLWAATVDLKAMEEELAEYVIGWRVPPETESKMHFHIYNLRELKLKADTLNAFISLTRAILFQKERAPFTPRDMELRRRILEIYPRNRPTPFPFLVNDEPKFEVKEGMPA